MSQTQAESGSQARVVVRALSKTFPGTRALDSVDVEVRAGEIQALVGGNGSGKSTLIKCLCGIYRADAGGQLRIGERETPAAEMTPELAREAGIHVVHQDLGVFPDLSVEENLALGYRYPTGVGARVRWRELRRVTTALIERFEIDARPETPLRSLSQGARTQVAIARALQDEGSEGSGLLILDEPTASLPAHEVTLLLAILRRYASRGQAILYVSHRLDEVLEIADRVTVLRDGATVGTFPADELSEDRLIELILGRQLESAFPEMPPPTEGEPMLAIKGLSAGPLRGVDLKIGPGEVVGIAGLLGSGRSELAHAIFGDLPIVSGEIKLNGRPYRPRRPLDAIRAGVALVPENRVADAVFPDLPVSENLSIASVSQYSVRGRIRHRQMRADARDSMRKFLVKASSDGALLSTLSGGNQQKVIVARWLRRAPKLLLLDEPTQGVDVGARADIYRLVREAVQGGASALVVASDYEELAHVSDRVLVLRGGRIVAEIRPPELTAHRLSQITYQSTGA
jgi:ribose transport system ATP-binding protein